MVELPFASGVVAAFIFLIFELVVFPVLIDSTSRIAAFFLIASANNGNEIVVEPIKFPFWSDNLLRRQWSHVFLLFVRIVFIAIPVYLEIGIDPLRVFTPVTRNIDQAFIVAPMDNWVQYSQTWGDNIFNLVDQSRAVFDRCTTADEHGWTYARVADISREGEAGTRRIQCIEETATPVFRSFPNEDAIENPSKYERNISLEMSLLQGRPEAFPPTSVPFFVVPTMDGPHAVNITMLGTQGLRCFPSTTFYSFGPDLLFMCELDTGDIREFYSAHTVGFTSEYEEMTATDDDGDDDASLIRVESARFELRTEYIERLQFKDTKISAGTLINSWEYVSSPGRLAEFHRRVRRAMYTRADNVLVEVNGSQLQRTVVDKSVLILFVIEVAVVLVLGIATQLWFRLKQKQLQMPNTLNGLSEVWARAEAVHENDREAVPKRISLRLRKSLEMPELDIFEPVGKGNSERLEVEESQLQ